MKSEQIYEKLKEIFLKINPSFDESKITINSKLREDLNMNSVGLIYIVVAIEDEFDIDLGDISFNDLSDVSDIVEYIKKEL